jgi:hypothetical protein
MVTAAGAFLAAFVIMVVATALILISGWVD